MPPRRSERGTGVVVLIALVVLSLTAFTLFSGTPEVSTVTGRDFAVVFDAGSSGSRVHVFQFIANKGQHDLETEHFMQLKPGLSSYGEDAQSAADSLTPLLSFAVSKVPKAQHSTTPIIVRATAGLRMLPGEQASAILNAVAKKLTQYDFKLHSPEEDVKIMDGADEGVYAWLAVNYLLKRVGQPADHTVSTIDLGGGSTQIAYAARDTSAQHTQLHRLTVGGQTYGIFTHSYLGFGLNTARQKVNKNQGRSFSGPCIPTESQAPDLHTCRKHVRKFVSDGFGRVAVPQDLSSIKSHQLPVFVLSFIYDVAAELGILQQPLQRDEPTLIPLTGFEQAAKDNCAKRLDDVKMIPGLDRQPGEIPLVCFDLVYISELLQKGYHRSSDDVLHAGKSIELNSRPIETQWPLGAGLMLV